MSRWAGAIVHHSASPDHEESMEADNIRRYHMQGRGWSDIGYHWVIEEIDDTPVVIMGRPAYRAGAHQPGANGDRLGVCFVGNYSVSSVKLDTLTAGAELLAGLCAMNGFGPGDITAHRDWKATECPGTRFPLEALIAMVGERVP